MTTTNVLVLAACLLPAACACPGAPPRRAPDQLIAAPDATGAALQVHDVRDLVDPPGDASATEALASEVRRAVGAEDPSNDASITVTAHGSAIVVRGTPEVQREVRALLGRRRSRI